MTWTGAGGLADLSQIATRVIFGETVTYTPLGGVAATLTAPFDAEYESVELGIDGQAITAVRPMLGVRDLDHPTGGEWIPTRVGVTGDTFIVRGTTYEVTDVQSDGQGASRLFAVEV